VPGEAQGVSTMGNRLVRSGPGRRQCRLTVCVATHIAALVCVPPAPQQPPECRTPFAGGQLTELFLLLSFWQQEHMPHIGTQQQSPASSPGLCRRHLDDTRRTGETVYAMPDQDMVTKATAPAEAWVLPRMRGLPEGTSGVEKGMTCEDTGEVQLHCEGPARQRVATTALLAGRRAQAGALGSLADEIAVPLRMFSTRSMDSRRAARLAEGPRLLLE
jgi:hypothetical protein